jgi:hypothetical protein
MFKRTTPRPLHDDHSIVLVHLGDSYVDYLADCIKQIRLFNDTSTPLYLIVDHNIQLYRSKFPDVEVVDASEIPCSDDRLRFQESSEHDAGFRNGFWKRTSERFCILNDFIHARSLKNVIHIENDVMIYFKVRDLLHVFSRYRIAVPFDSPERAIASIVFIRDPGSIAKLSSFIATNAAKGYNDMVILSMFREQFSGYIDGLPIAPPNYEGLQNTIYTKNFDDFGSIFDAACIGQFLGGIDPRNSNSVNTVGFINETSVVKPNLLNIHWMHTSEGLKVPYAGNTRINNLHIHSKNLQAFSSSHLHEETGHTSTVVSALVSSIMILASLYFILKPIPVV